jgi:hypothetical protein
MEVEALRYKIPKPVSSARAIKSSGSVFLEDPVGYVGEYDLSVTLSRKPSENVFSYQKQDFKYGRPGHPRSALELWRGQTGPIVTT